MLRLCSDTVLKVMNLGNETQQGVVVEYFTDVTRSNGGPIQNITYDDREDGYLITFQDSAGLF